MKNKLNTTKYFECFKLNDESFELELHTSCSTYRLDALI